MSTNKNERVSGAGFTAGPWRYRIATGSCDTHINSVVAGAGAVCVIPYKYGTPEQRAANRNLILSAPSLYAALERITARLSEVGTILDVDLDAAVDQARRALAEARGDARP